MDDNENSRKFSKLKKYKNIDFAKANPTFTFSLLYEELECKIFAVSNIPISIDYIDPNPNENNYAFTLEYLLQNSFYDFEVPVSTEDKILILSTCTVGENIRFVVAAKLK